MDTMALKKEITKPGEVSKVSPTGAGLEGASIPGSEAVMRALVAEGVDTIFGYPGGAIMPIYDSLYDYHDKVKHILVRHEQGAIHAAQGYALSLIHI